MEFLKFFSGKPSSKNIAKDRLKLILIHDREDFSMDLLEEMKTEILQVISNYVEIDTEDVEIKLTRTEECEGSSPALIASIPIKKMKNRK